MAVVWRMVWGLTDLAAMDGHWLLAAVAVLANDVPHAEACEG